MRPAVILLGVLLVAGCSTGGPKEDGIAATFVHPQTGDTKVCYEQNPGMLAAVCIPCGMLPDSLDRWGCRF